MSGTLGSEKLSRKCNTKSGPGKCYLDNVGPLESGKIDLASITAEFHRIGLYYLGRLMPMQFTK